MTVITISNGFSEDRTIAKNEVHIIKPSADWTEQVYITVIDGTINISNYGNLQASQMGSYSTSGQSPLKVTGVDTMTNKYSISCYSYSSATPA